MALADRNARVESLTDELDRKSTATEAIAGNLRLMQEQLASLRVVVQQRIEGRASASLPPKTVATTS